MKSTSSPVSNLAGWDKVRSNFGSRNIGRLLESDAPVVRGFSTRAADFGIVSRYDFFSLDPLMYTSDEAYAEVASLFGASPEEFAEKAENMVADAASASRVVLYVDAYTDRQSGRTYKHNKLKFLDATGLQLFTSNIWFGENRSKRLLPQMELTKEQVSKIVWGLCFYDGEPKVSAVNDVLCDPSTGRRATVTRLVPTDYASVEAFAEELYAEADRIKADRETVAQSAPVTAAAAPATKKETDAERVSRLRSYQVKAAAPVAETKKAKRTTKK